MVISTSIASRFSFGKGSEASTVLDGTGIMQSISGGRFGFVAASVLWIREWGRLVAHANVDGIFVLVASISSLSF